MAKKKKASGGRRKLRKEVGWGKFKKIEIDPTNPKKAPYSRKGKFAYYDIVRDAARKQRGKTNNLSVDIKVKNKKFIIKGQPFVGDTRRVYLIAQGKKRPKVVRAVFPNKKMAQEYLKELKKKHPRATFKIVEGWI